MLGFKRRPAGPQEELLTEALAALEQAEADLAAAPWDARRREQFRLAHNAVADLSDAGVPSTLTA